MSSLRLFLYILSLAASGAAHAVPANPKSLPPVTLKPVALGHAATPIDFNAMIDETQDHGERLKNRLRTKMRGRSLHLTRGHVHIVKANERTRSEASVKAVPKRRPGTKGGKDVQVTLMPQPVPAPPKLTRNGN